MKGYMESESLAEEKIRYLERAGLYFGRQFRCDVEHQQRIGHLLGAFASQK